MPSSSNSHEPEGLSRTDYWLCWAGAGIAFALLAFWPNIGLGFGNTAIVLLAVVLSLAVPVLWALRLRNAGRSAWWILPICLGLIAISMASCDSIAGRAGNDAGGIPNRTAGQVIRNFISPEMILVVGLAFLAVTLIIGLLPPKPVDTTEGQP